MATKKKKAPKKRRQGVIPPAELKYRHRLAEQVETCVARLLGLEDRVRVLELVIKPVATAEDCTDEAGGLE